MIWEVKSLEACGKEAEIKLTTKTGRMFITVPLSEVSSYPLGAKFTANLIANDGSAYSPDTEAENNAKPSLVERQAGADMVLAIDPNPEVR